MIHQRIAAIICGILLSTSVIFKHAAALTNAQIKSIEKQQYLYDYFEESDEHLISRDYVVIETNPKAHLMCPKDYFISKLFYRFVTTPEQRQRLNIKDQAFLYNIEDAVKADGDSSQKSSDLCATLLHCVGYQACMFKYSNEFCRNDPLPRFRKTMSVYLTCEHSDKLEDYIANHGFSAREKREINARKDSVMHITHSSFIEQGVRNYNDIRIFTHPMPSNEVFDISCPPLSEVYKSGYRGECTRLPPNQPAAIRKLWHILGRVPASECRRELTHVYCAFKYNSTGGCFPPEHVKQTKEKRQIEFNFQILPTVGKRIDPTPYNRLRADPHRSLIPARLGFMILIHNNAKLCIKLLMMVHRPQHYYVIHVDKRQPAVRDELEALIRKKFKDYSNIRVLPEERSFVTSWASYAYIRAHLECVEELLRMGGLWDFAINLSSADLPLRPIEDLAASLAPHRGETFFNTFTVHNLTGDPLWYSCGGYVYEVSSKGAFPPGLLQHQSVWTVFAREFAEYIVNSASRADVNPLQLYLQTVRTCDEYYFSNVLRNSRFRKSYYHRISTHVRDNQRKNIDNLCRHLGDDADFCGQGPGIFVNSDLENLQDLSHSRFFARKFSTDSKDKIRQSVIKWQQDGLYESLGRVISGDMLLELSRLSLSQLLSSPPVSQLLGDSVEMQVDRVVSWQLLPRWRVSDPCCSKVHQVLDGYNEYYIQTLFNVSVTTQRDQSQPPRSLHVIASLSGAPNMICYGAGHLRGLTVSVESRVQDLTSKMNKQQLTPVHRITSPSHNKLHVNLYMHYGSVGRACAARSRHTSEQGGAPKYAQYSNLDKSSKTADPLTLRAWVRSPGGEVWCEDEVTVPLEAGGVVNDRWGYKSGYLHRHTIACDRPFLQYQSELGSEGGGGGVWRVVVKEAGVENAYTYTYPLYITGGGSDGASDTTTSKLPLREMYKVTDVMFLSEQPDYYSDQSRLLTPPHNIDVTAEAKLLAEIMTNTATRSTTAQPQHQEVNTPATPRLATANDSPSTANDSLSTANDSLSTTNQSMSSSIGSDSSDRRVGSKQVEMKNSPTGQQQPQSRCFDHILMHVTFTGLLGISTFVTLTLCGKRGAAAANRASKSTAAADYVFVLMLTACVQAGLLIWACYV